MFCKKNFNKLFFLILILLIISKISILAQEFPLDKQKRDFEIWTHTNISYNFEGGSYLFGRLHTQSLGKAKSFLNHKQYRVGYAQLIQKKLHLGGFLQNDKENTFTYRLFLKHRSKISKVYFDKQISLEFLKYAKPQFDNFEQGRLWFGLSYPFKLGEKKQFYPQLSYEIFKTLDKAEVLQNQRKIDRTRLRFDLAYEFSPKVKLSLFALRETSYYFALAQFALDNTGQMIQKKPERRLNLLRPVYGFSLYLTFGKLQNGFNFLP